MRRPEKRITNENMVHSILKEATVCRIGLCKDNVPYVVPMNFAYYDNALYLHAARAGKKLDIINVNPHVCFEMEYKTEVAPAPTSCGWSMKYYSIIGWGNASLITDAGDKTRALDLLMEKYAGAKDLSYTDTILDKVAIIRIEITEMTGKFSGY
ncbi:pyridoxamine 5'-phosphate oxidase family protein [Methanolobus psychrotolerans]|uniref:pyridoxamine 5'-phosphate oxidase family protein n=1 Tax=Methanolobus psychrotolerans TaxID=1874706 RepID=UPI000B91A045|nr:pyridoxamine 5'-phosphate oxidase family protein [Methanolobus psychrotolerans]